MHEGHLVSHSAVGIDIRQVRRTFPQNVLALADINLSVKPGEFLAILGPSGCGKSTLLRLIAHLDHPTAGTIQITSPNDPHVKDPHLVHSLNYFSSGRHDIAYVFQDAHLLPWRNVLRNAALPLELMGVNRSERYDRARAVLEQVGLTDALRRYPAQLSGGMRMRVSLARALVTNPQLLLLDEPFAALDEITRQRLDEQLRQLWIDRGMTVIFVTHSTAEAVFLADRAVVMSARPGRIIMDQPLDLPRERVGPLRATPQFAAQTRELYEALERGGA